MGIPAAQGVAASGQPPAGDQANAVLTGTLGALGPGQAFAFRGPMNLAIWAAVATTLTTTSGSLAASVASATGLAVGNSINSVNVPPGAVIGVLSGTDVTLALPPVTLPGMVSAGYSAITNLPSTAGLTGATVTGPGIQSGTTVLRVSVPASAGILGSVELSKVPTTAPANSMPLQQFSFARNGNAIVTTGADAAATFTGGLIVGAQTVQLERSFDGGSTFIACNIGGNGALAQWVNAGPINITFGEPEKNVLYRLNCIAYTSGTLNYRISQTGGAAESLAIGPLSNG